MSPSAGPGSEPAHTGASVCRDSAQPSEGEATLQSLNSAATFGQTLDLIKLDLKNESFFFLMCHYFPDPRTQSNTLQICYIVMNSRVRAAF